MIMRSLDDENTEAFLDDHTLPAADTAGRDGLSRPDWRFVPLDPRQFRRLDAAHRDIAPPHMQRTRRPKVDDVDFNQTLYFG